MEDRSYRHEQPLLAAATDDQKRHFRLTCQFEYEVPQHLDATRRTLDAQNHEVVVVGNARNAIDGVVVLDGDRIRRRVHIFDKDAGFG